MIIAFLGCDGSGKTTLAKKLIKELRKRGFNCKYRHQYDFLVSNYIGKNIKNKVSGGKFKKKPSFYHKIWPFMVWLNLFINWIKLKVNMVGKERINIYDRYIFDMMVGWDMDNKLNFLSKWLFRNFPKPDVLFLLDAKPESMVKRVKEGENIDLNTCKKKKRMYLEFAKGNDIKIINTEKDVEKSFRDLMGYIKPYLF